MAVAYLAPLHAAQPPAAAGTLEFANGRWFDGAAFRTGTLYSVDGVFTDQRPSSIDKSIDLQNQYAVPPFAETHSHNVEGEWNIASVVARYLRDGVFYVQVLNQIPEFSNQIGTFINRADSIDVIFANGGFTASGGHPAPLYRDILREHRYRSAVGDLPPQWFDNRAYVLVDSAADLEARWPKFLQTRPSLVKIFLVCSEQYAAPAAFCHGRKGVDPQLVPRIVALARQAGLKVAAHAETVEDFRIGARAGVDEIVHLPGWFLVAEDLAEHARLTEADARLAARQHVTIQTTTIASHTMDGVRAVAGSNAKGAHEGNRQSAATQHAHGAVAADDHRAYALAKLKRTERELQIANLKLLRRNAVPIVIGTDHGDTPLAEVLNLHGMQIFTNLELLKMWSETSARAVFPKRKIARLAAGYEASFLLLGGDPLEDFQNVRNIRLRVKRGHVLPEPAISDSGPVHHRQ